MWRQAPIAVFLALLTATLPSAAADLDGLPDGLHTWRIDGTSDIHSCCVTARDGKVTSSGCRLDGRTMSVSTGGDCAAGPGAAQVYVRVANGDTVRIWLLSSACPVEAGEQVADHGLVSADASVAWFRSVIEGHNVDKSIREQALFALVQSESDAAFRYLDRLLTGR